MTLTEFQERWLQALESGQYKQSVGRLHTDDGFCCLGVACDLYQPENWRKQTTKTFEGEVYYTYGENAHSVPPQTVLEALGIYGDGAIQTLIHLNDEHRNNFTEIAAWVRENQVEVFGEEDDDGVN